MTTLLSPYKGYTGTKEYSESDRTWYGKVTGVGNLISYEAEKEKDLQEAFEDAVDDFLDIVEELDAEED